MFFNQDLKIYFDFSNHFQFILSKKYWYETLDNSKYGQKDILKTNHLRRVNFSTIFAYKRVYSNRYIIIWMLHQIYYVL